MDDQFLNQEFQKELWKAIWEDLLPYKEKESKVTFATWFTSIMPEKKLRLEYQSKYKKYENFYINKSLVFENKGHTTIKLVLDSALTNGRLNSYSSQPAIKFSAYDEGYIPNCSSSGDSIKSKFTRFSKKDFMLNPTVEVEFVGTKKGSSFVISPEIADINGDAFLNVDILGRGHWSALDAVKVDETTIKIFLTFDYEKPDFTDLVFDIVFPKPLKEFNVGFPDKPNYFS